VCTRLTVARPIDLRDIDIEQVKNNMLYLHVCSGALVRIGEHNLQVVDARPDAACVRVQCSTLVSWAAADEPDCAISSEPLSADTVADQPDVERVSFELRVSEACAPEAVRALREICAFPAKHKSAFDHMGIECPRGLLLHGVRAHCYLYAMTVILTIVVCSRPAVARPVLFVPWPRR
jgi:hypothetical protein